MTKSLDELYAPKAMSLDELFAALRPPPLLPVGYGSSDNGASMPASSAPAANMAQPIPLNLLLGGAQSVPLTQLNYTDEPRHDSLSQNHDFGGPSTLGVLGGEVGGMGVPIVPKPRKGLGPAPTTVTSPLSRAMLGARKVPLDEYLPWSRMRTPTIGSSKAYAGTLSALTRRAFPLAGIPLIGWDLVNSDNRLRTGMGDAFGVLGGALGGMVGGPTLVGSLPGALAGSYAGNELGLGLYDAFGSRMEDRSIPRRDGRAR
jgi:hypothetical protein